MNAAATRLLVAILWLAGIAASPVLAQTDAQGAPGRIEGRVVTREGRGLADVTVSASGALRVNAVTDTDGNFALEGISPGRIEIRFSRIGYASTSRAVFVESGGTGRVEAVLSEEAIELAPLDVSVTGRSLYLDANGFYRRSERGFGRQYSRTDLDELHMLEISDAFHGMSRVLMRYDPYMANRVMAVSPRRGGEACALTVYVDGVRTLDPNLNQVPLDWVLGMEVYLGAEAPAQYRISNGCGAVLLWTKDGRR
jgi:hypothetical protein